jgi:hypothetical protein
MRLPNERFSVVVLMNRNDGDPGKIANRIARYYFPAFAAPQPKVAIVPLPVLRSYTGYYDLGGSLFVVTERTGKLVWAGFGPNPVELLPISEDTFFCADPDINPDRDWRITFAGDKERQVNHLVYKARGKDVSRATYLGPLAHSHSAQADSDPTLTKKAEAVLKALAQGGKAVEQVDGLTDGAKKDLVNVPQSELAGLQSLCFVAVQNVANRGIERHGGKVSRIVYYRLKTDKVTRYVLVYVTAASLITDEDVVDD